MQVAPCYSMGEEQGQDHLLHHPHLRPHRPIAEAEEVSRELALNPQLLYLKFIREAAYT